MTSNDRDKPAALRVPATILEAIYRHARASFPAECCGYLRGSQDGDAVDEVVACRNAQVDGDHPTRPERGAESGFVITGTELLAFARSLDTDRPARILYHSHTNGRAYFSEVDREVAAGPGGGPTYPVQHLVVGITAAAVTEVAQYGWSETAKDFVELARWPVLQ